MCLYANWICHGVEINQDVYVPMCLDANWVCHGVEISQRAYVEMRISDEESI